MRLLDTSPLLRLTQSVLLEQPVLAWPNLQCAGGLALLSQTVVNQSMWLQEAQPALLASAMGS